MGILFAVLITITFGFAFNSVQSNTMSAALQSAFAVDPVLSGAVISLLTLFIIFGGIHRIAAFSSVIVPIMAVGYILLALFVVLTNIGRIPDVVSLIVGNAFGWHQALGGGMGAALMQGIKRGLFSNESGMGSAPIVAAAARTRNPVRQALVSSTGTFWDTVVICALTGLVLVSSILAYPDINYSDGPALTKVAFDKIPYIGAPLLTFGIITFAFSTILGWCYYGEKSIEYLGGKKLTLVYRGIFIVATFFGAVIKLAVVWNLADLTNALMAIPNLVSLLMLSGVIAAETKKYLWNNRLDADADAEDNPQ